jgi:hypothetical protein
MTLITLFQSACFNCPSECHLISDEKKFRWVKPPNGPVFRWIGGSESPKGIPRWRMQAGRLILLAN